MKHLAALLLASSFACTALAQDPCKQIKKEVSANNTLTEFTSPFSTKEEPMLHLKRSISTDEDAPFDNFIAIFRAKCAVDDIYETSATGGKSEKSEKTISIIFDDNSRIKDDTVEVMHDLTPDRAEAIRYIYYPLIPETANDFATKKITKFIIAGQEVPIPADESTKIMQYANCIKMTK